MRPLSELTDRTLSQVTSVFTDIDDTLTTNGVLPASVYSALEQLTESGIDVVPVTGRPAGWCDMIARFWPVAGIVGENGAFYFAYDRSSKIMHQFFVTEESDRIANRHKLDKLRDRILHDVPGAGVASDQFCRVADLAIDICEDVTPLNPDEVNRVIALFKESGATAKLSSIHVNGWFGDYDKLSTCRVFADDVLKLNIDADKHAVIFVGDSPNDGPMFSFFPNSCGVANVRDFSAAELDPPAYVASHRCGDGFVEVADRLLAVRR